MAEAQSLIVPAAPASTGRLLNIQRFTVAGANAYTPTAGTTSIFVRLVGGGGGGGGVAAPAAGQAAIGAGGGAGGYAERFLPLPAGAITVTIGAAGAAGAAGGGNGGAGGTTSVNFGVVLQGTGGGGGNFQPSGAGLQMNVGGTPGVGSGGDLQFNGWEGEVGTRLSGTQAQSGGGGNSPFGAGGLSVGAANSVAGNAGSGFGSGGSGAMARNPGAQAAGGAGAGGYAEIWEYA